MQHQGFRLELFSGLWAFHVNLYSQLKVLSVFQILVCCNRCEIRFGIYVNFCSASLSLLAATWFSTHHPGCVICIHSLPDCPFARAPSSVAQMFHPPECFSLKIYTRKLPPSGSQLVSISSGRGKTVK